MFYSEKKKIQRTAEAVRCVHGRLPDGRLCNNKGNLAHVSQIRSKKRCGPERRQRLLMMKWYKKPFKASVLMITAIFS